MSNLSVWLHRLANASYGFTGADTSHLCCKPLAEACLRMGNAYTRAASRLVEEAAAGGRIPGAAVLYANTGPRAKGRLVQLAPLKHHSRSSVVPRLRLCGAPRPHRRGGRARGALHR